MNIAPSIPADLNAPWNGCKGRKPYKWNVYPAAREDYRLVRRLRPTWSKDQFLAERDAAISTARTISITEANLRSKLTDKHGTSGTYLGSRGWDSWPIEARNAIGDLSVLRGQWYDVARAYHLCAGKRSETFFCY